MEIRKIREKLQLSQQELSDITGIPKARIAKWEQGKGKPKEVDSSILRNFFEEKGIIEQVIEEGEKPYILKRRDLKSEAHKKTVPFYDAPASGGDITVTEMTAIHAPAGTIDVGDLLNDSEAAIRIYGNSMLPNYPPGCVVGLSKCNKAFIEPGEVYVIETTDRRILKRLFYKNDNSDGDIFTCYSDNILKFEGGARHGKLAYPPFDLPKREVMSIYVVTGVIKRNANSVIINR